MNLFTLGNATQRCLIPPHKCVVLTMEATLGLETGKERLLIIRDRGSANTH